MFSPNRSLFSILDDMAQITGPFDYRNRVQVPSITSEEDATVVRCVVPGVNKEDIDITVHPNNVLEIVVERGEDVDAGLQLASKERYQTQISHEFDVEEVVSMYDRGILELRIPRPSEETSQRKILVQ